jgi:hypothetical protein
MTSAELAKQAPDVIESEIEMTRASLDRRISELERRLDPRRRVQSVRHELDARAPQLLAWGALAAIATGTAMAVSGWRRVRAGEDGSVFLCECVADVPLEADGLP